MNFETPTIWINQPVGIWQRLKYWLKPWPKKYKSLIELQKEVNFIQSMVIENEI